MRRYVMVVTESFGDLHNLETLKLSCRGFYVPSRSLSGLTKLKSLTLTEVFVDKNIYSVLEPFENLTVLEFDVLNFYIGASEIKLMNQLRKLSLGSAANRVNNGFLQHLRECQFPCLQYLYLCVQELPEEEEMEIRRNMPCLRKMVVC